MARIIKRGSPDDDSNIIADTGTVLASTGEPERDHRESAEDDSGTEPGANGDSKGYVDPTTATTNRDSGGSPRRRIGRPIGSRNRSTTTASKTQISQSVAETLFTIHLAAGALLKVPELALTEEESTKLAKAVTRVTDLYELSAPSEKVLAWIQLGSAAGIVYGPRIMAHKIRASNNRPKIVTPFPGGSVTVNPIPPTQAQPQSTPKPNGTVQPPKPAGTQYAGLDMHPVETTLQ